jgi:hypothetical protein
MRSRALAAAGALLLGGCSAFGIRAGTEQPGHTVVERLGRGVEVRRYGPRLAAETTVAGKGEAFGARRSCSWRATSSARTGRGGRWR